MPARFSDSPPEYLLGCDGPVRHIGDFLNLLKDSSKGFFRAFFNEVFPGEPQG